MEMLNSPWYNWFSWKGSLEHENHNGVYRGIAEYMGDTINKTMP